VLYEFAGLLICLTGFMVHWMIWFKYWCFCVCF